MKKLLSVLILTCVMISGHAQVDSVTAEKVSIINAKHKVEGIYKTFDEFRRNQPFYTDSFEIIEAAITKMKFSANTAGRTKADYIDSVTIDGKTKRLIRPPSKPKFFGYSKDNKVFIAFWRFHEVTEWGHLTLIKVKELRLNESDGVTSVGSGGLVVTSASGKGMEKMVNEWYILDYLSGDLSPIKTSVLKKKFRKHDKELFKEYNKETSMWDVSVHLKYIRRFNQRNPIRF